MATVTRKATLEYPTPESRAQKPPHPQEYVYIRLHLTVIPIWSYFEMQQKIETIVENFLSLFIFGLNRARNIIDAEDLMVKDYNVIIERDVEGFYVASVPSLRGCHTQAKSLDELMTRMTEAIELCLEDLDDSFEALDFVGVQKITVTS